MASHGARRGTCGQSGLALRRAASALTPLEPPPTDLAGFPSRLVGRGARLYRIHDRDNKPWWFSNLGAGRFDLLSEGRGTCYLAATPVGALIETFRASEPIPELEVQLRSLATLSVRKRCRLADCATSRARRYGITGAIHSQPHYDLTQAWAAAFAQAGFDGIWYRLSHDPAQRELGIALFGPAGEQDLPVRATDPIDAVFLEEARRRFGLVVTPSPS